MVKCESLKIATFYCDDKCNRFLFSMISSCLYYIHLDLLYFKMTPYISSQISRYDSVRWIRMNCDILFLNYWKYVMHLSFSSILLWLSLTINKSFNRSVKIVFNKSIFIFSNKMFSFFYIWKEKNCITLDPSIYIW